MPNYKMEIYVPKESLKPILKALDEAGAGRPGNYRYCAALTEVTGMWLAEQGAKPHIGEAGKLCTAPEIKIETLCAEECLQKAIEAVRAVHPYEEPLINSILLQP